MSKNTTRALAGPRTSNTLIPSYTATRGATTWPQSKGWTTVLGGGYDIVMYETYLDQSGFVNDHMTCFPESAAIQDPGNYLCDKPDTQMQVIDMISTERMAPANIINWLRNDFALPGMIETNVDWSQVVWGQYRTMLPQATFQANGSLYLNGSMGSFGSGQPTTAAKLWVYRFVVLYGAIETTVITIPSSRIILNSIHAKEADLEFMMRQKRTYELGSDF